MRSIRLADVLDAMERDSRPKVREYLVAEDGACAIGGAALELGISPNDLLDGLRKVGACDRLETPPYPLPVWTTPSLGRQIEALNDHTRRSKRSIARFIRKAGCDLEQLVRLPR